MPAMNTYAFSALQSLAQSARAAFLRAAIRPESDVERAAATSVSDAFEAAAAAPEALARLTDGYLTALSGGDFLQPFNGAVDDAALPADYSALGLIFAALGMRPDPRAGMHYRPESYLAR
jgi:hypothetical protein